MQSVKNGEDDQLISEESGPTKQRRSSPEETLKGLVSGW